MKHEKRQQRTTDEIFQHEIRPLLQRMEGICQAAGIHLFVECWLERPFRRVLTKPAEGPVPYELLLHHTLALAEGDLDRFLGQVIADAQTRGHQSVYLWRLGVSAQAVEEPDEKRDLGDGEARTTVSIRGGD